MLAVQKGVAKSRRQLGPISEIRRLLWNVVVVESKVGMKFPSFNSRLRGNYDAGGNSNIRNLEHESGELGFREGFYLALSSQSAAPGRSTAAFLAR